MVTIENWEEYAILRADGELDAEGTAALETFLAAHPELAEEARMFDSLRLVPDEAEVFSGKESLLKPEPRVIAFDRRWMYGVAAGVALLVGSLVFLRSGRDGGEGAAQLAGGVRMPARTEDAASAKPVATQPDVIAPSVSESNTVAQTAPLRKVQNTPANAPQQNIAIPLPQREESIPTMSESIQPLISADTRMLAVNTPKERRAEPLTKSGAESTPSITNPDESRGLIDRLPIDAERFALVDDLRQTASDRIQSIRETREKIRNTDVTIALGKRDLFTVHF